MKKPVWPLALALSSILILSPYLTTQGRSEPPSQGPTKEVSALACSPDRPTALPGERVALSAWANTTDPGSLQYAWSIRTGRLIGSGAEVTWDLTGVIPGSYEATVAVTLPNGKEAKCSLSMLVIPKETKGPETGWSLLRSGIREEKGYGLYSYVLFASRPTKETNERYLKVLEAYVALAESVQSLEGAGIPRRELNVTCVPVMRLPPKDRPTPEWFLENYDFARAKAILKSFPGEYRDGPYIISVLLPPPPRGKKYSGNYLYQNLSAVPPRIVLDWAKAFMNQAAKVRYWEPRTTEQLVLELRTVVAQLAIGWPIVRNAMKDLIEWKSTLKL
jgi:hypothetical protein